jgi:hypothetical protein
MLHDGMLIKSHSQWYKLDRAWPANTCRNEDYSHGVKLRLMTYSEQWMFSQKRIRHESARHSKPAMLHQNLTGRLSQANGANRKHNASE